MMIMRSSFSITISRISSTRSTLKAITFRSTNVAPGTSGTWAVTGDLTVRDVTRPITLQVDFDGANASPIGDERIAFSAATEVDREDWGLTWNVAMESGGVLVSKKVKIELDVQLSEVAAGAQTSAA